MCRTIYPKKKTKCTNNPFPLYKDKIYQSLTTEQQKFVYNIFLQPITNQKNYECFLAATSRDIKKSTANTYTSELLKNPKIVHCVEKVKKHYRRQLRITPERILKEEAAIALSDVADFLTEDGLLKCAPGKLPVHARRAISGFKKKTVKGVDYWEVTLWNKGDSLSRLQKVMGMNSPTEHKLSGALDVNATVTRVIDLSNLSNYDIECLKDIQQKLGVNDTDQKED